MEQYISKSALVAEIEKCYNECLKRAKIVDSDYWNAKGDAYRNILVILDDTLEVKEVQEEQSVIKDTPATNYEVPRIKAWIARQDERDEQWPWLMLYFHKPLRNEEAGTWFGYEGVILHQEGKYASVKWEDEPLEINLAVFGNTKQEEPVSEDLEKAAGNYAFTMSGEDEVSKYYAFKAGAKWQEEHKIKGKG